MADVKQHAFRCSARHLARLQVDHKKGLSAFDLAVISPFLLHARKDVPLVVAEVHAQFDELFRTRNFCDRLDGADADVQLVQDLLFDQALLRRMGFQFHLKTSRDRQLPAFETVVLLFCIIPVVKVASHASEEGSACITGPRRAR